jgi:hypothetical protein
VSRGQSIEIWEILLTMATAHEESDKISMSLCQEKMIRLLDCNPLSCAMKASGQYPVDGAIKMNQPKEIIRRMLEHTPTSHLRSDSFFDIVIQYPTACMVVLEKYPEVLLKVDKKGCTVLHFAGDLSLRRTIVINRLYTRYEQLKDEDSLRNIANNLKFAMKFEGIPQDELINLIMKFPQAVSMPNEDGCLPLHFECENMCRKAVICKYVELYPQGLSVAAEGGNLPLHIILSNILSTEEMVLMIIDMYPEAIRCPDTYGSYPIHIECLNAGRWSIISRFIELYPEAMKIPSGPQLIPLHYLMAPHMLSKCNIASLTSKYPELLDIVDFCGCMIPTESFPETAFIEEGTVLQLIDAYPVALQYQGCMGNLPIHIECLYEARKSVIMRCIELYPESLEIANDLNSLPLSCLLNVSQFSADIICQMIDRYPKSLEHRDNGGNLPIHIECSKGSQIQVISKCVEFYPEGLEKVDGMEYMLPLQCLLMSDTSSLDAALYVMDQYPEAIKHRRFNGDSYPLHAECMKQCRLRVLSKCYEFYPDAIGVYLEQDEDLKLPFHIAWYNASLLHTGNDDDDVSELSMLTSLNKHRDSLVFLLSKYPAALNNPPHYPFMERHFTPASLRFLFNLFPSANLLEQALDGYHDLNWEPRSSLIYTSLQLQMSTDSKSGRRINDNVPRYTLHDPLMMRIVVLLKKFVSISSLNREDKVVLYDLGRGEDVGDHWLRSIIMYL